jgi:hypothetical protein
MDKGTSFIRTAAWLGVMGLLLLTLPLQAGITGKIAGKVVDDKNGEPLVGANVVIVGTTLGGSTTPRGEYFILNVPPGVYSLKVSMIGFAATTITDVRVIVDQTTTVNFRLKEVALAGQEVTIVAERERIEKNLTSSKQVVESEVIDKLAVTTLDEVVKSIPGVVSHQDKIHVRGGREGEELLLIDGASIRDPLFNDAIAPINPNAIAEFQVITGTFNAEYGNALSGVFNTVLKDGGDRWEGSVTYRSSLGGLDHFKGEGPFADKDIYDEALNPEAKVTRKASGEDPFQIAEGTLGGPLGDKLRLFVSARYLDNPTSFPSLETKVLNIQPKLTYRLTDNIKISLQGMVFDAERPFDPSFDINKVNGSDGRHNYWIWKYNLDAFPRTEEKGWQVGLNWSQTLSAKTFYNLRINRFRKEREDFSTRNGVKLVYDSPAEPNHEQPAQTQPTGNLPSAGYFDLTSEYGIYNLNKENATTLEGVLTSQVTPAHQIKLGAQLTLFDIDRLGHDLFFGRAVDSREVQTQRVEVNPYEGTVYLQDQIELAEMILNVGGRLDFFNVNADNGIWEGFNPFTGRRSSTESHVRLSPRLGFSHPVGETRTVHYAYGTFFQRPRFYDLLENYLAQNDGGTESGFFIYLGNPALEPQLTTIYEIGVQQAIGEDFKIDVTGYYKDIDNLVAMQEVFNRLATDPRTGQSYAHYFTKSSDHFGNVRGFEVTIDKRYSNYFSGRLSYTFSSAKGTASGPVNEGAGIFREVEGTVTENTLFLTTLDFARTHVFNGYLDIRSRPGTGTLRQVGANFLFNIQSGLPITSRVGLAQAALGERGPWNYQVDLKVDAALNFGTIRPTVFLFIENLFNVRNVLSIKDPSSFFRETEENLFFHNAAGPRNDLTAYGVPFTPHLGVTLEF